MFRFITLLAVVAVAHSQTYVYPSTWATSTRQISSLPLATGTTQWTWAPTYQYQPLLQPLLQPVSTIWSKPLVPSYSFGTYQHLYPQGSVSYQYQKQYQKVQPLSIYGRSGRAIAVHQPAQQQIQQQIQQTQPQQGLLVPEQTIRASQQQQLVDPQTQQQQQTYVPVQGHSVQSLPVQGIPLQAVQAVPVQAVSVQGIPAQGYQGVQGIPAQGYQGVQGIPAQIQFQAVPTQGYQQVAPQTIPQSIQPLITGFIPAPVQQQIQQQQQFQQQQAQPLISTGYTQQPQQIQPLLSTGYIQPQSQQIQSQQVQPQQIVLAAPQQAAVYAPQPEQFVAQPLAQVPFVQAAAPLPSYPVSYASGPVATPVVAQQDLNTLGQQQTHHQQSLGHHQVSHVSIPGQVGVGGGYTSSAFYEAAPAIPSDLVLSDVKVGGKIDPQQHGQGHHQTLGTSVSGVQSFEGKPQPQQQQQPQAVAQKSSGGSQSIPQ